MLFRSGGPGERWGRGRRRCRGGGGCHGTRCCPSRRYADHPKRAGSPVPQILRCCALPRLLGPRAHAPSFQLLLRTIGVRDAVLGARTVLAPDADLTRWSPRWHRCPSWRRGSWASGGHVTGTRRGASSLTPYVLRAGWNSPPAVRASRRIRGDRARERRPGHDRGGSADPVRLRSRRSQSGWKRTRRASRASSRPG